MAFWIELHCDANTPTCYSHSNNNQGISVINQQTVIGLRMLKARAREAGWRFIYYKEGFQWVCPNCWKARTLT